MEQVMELINTVLQPLAIFGLLCLGFWLVSRHAGSLHQTLVKLGISKLEFKGITIELVQYQLITAVSQKPYVSALSEKDKLTVQRLTERFAPVVAGGRVLWVDDKPSGNRHERAALTGLGIEVQTRRTNEEAQRELADTTEAWDLVISDWRRSSPNGEPEGLALLKWTREKRPMMPFLIYTWSRSLDDRKKHARSEGAHGLTDNPIELYRWVLAWLASRQHTLND
jgi:CheY-like chemotaxis protein